MVLKTHTAIGNGSQPMRDENARSHLLPQYHINIIQQRHLCPGIQC